jgi:hypothetical protein
MAAMSIASSRGDFRAAYKSQSVWIVMSLLVVALATRAGRFGDPAIQMDEQFYLLVADRMWHGALPYVDIWDRKPILLFLIYAALRPFSPNGIVAYQIGATLFATMTAFVIVLIATRFADLRGAWLAGVSYLLYLPLLEGAGGQSPVFYNLFMALGAWEVLRAGEVCETDGIKRHGLRAVLWAGLAIQVKYTAAIEGCAFGLWLIGLLIRRHFSVTHIITQSAFWAAAALAPTLLALSFYAVIGHAEDFIQSNFVSIFQRQQQDGALSARFLWTTAIRLAPLLLIACSAPVFLRRASREAPVSFLLLWLAFAVVGFFALGYYYGHYALPLTVPMMIVCAPLLATPVGAVAGMLVFGWAALLVTGFPSDAIRNTNQRRVAAMVEAVRPYTAHGCIYVNDGPTILYLLTGSCLPTRYVFPGHLDDATEAEATHATKSMIELLATRPSAIFVPDTPSEPPRNAVTAALLQAALAQNYQAIARLPDVFPVRDLMLYARKDLLPLTDAHP